MASQTWLVQELRTRALCQHCGINTHACVRATPEMLVHMLYSLCMIVLGQRKSLALAVSWQWLDYAVSQGGQHTDVLCPLSDSGSNTIYGSFATFQVRTVLITQQQFESVTSVRPGFFFANMFTSENQLKLKQCFLNYCRRRDHSHSLRTGSEQSQHMVYFMCVKNERSWSDGIFFLPKIDSLIRCCKKDEADATLCIFPHIS